MELNPGPASGQRTSHAWRLRTRTLALGPRTAIMGIVNITADSFSDGGQYLAPEEAIAHGLRLLDEGAELLDLGAESTRPGAQAGDPATAAIPAEQEQARLLPVIEGILRARPDTILSIDTYKATTARAALRAGAEIINDVSGFTWDPAMASACAQAGCGIIAMHTRGTPVEWPHQYRQSGPELIAMVAAGLVESLRLAQAAGIASEHIVLDPGYGFGKRGDENYALLARQHELLALGRPLLAGLSRKSFLGKTATARGAPATPESLETASAAALVAAILHGASIVRVHSVSQAVAASAIADALLG
jgi:dihydropteroate synthase